MRTHSGGVVLSIFGFSLVWLLSVTIQAQHEIAHKPLVYQLPGMEAIMSKTYQYKDSLQLEIFLPNSFDEGSFHPVIIFVCGFRNLNFRKGRMYRDWCKLMAMHGIAAILYEVNDPINSLDHLVDFIDRNVNSLRVDSTKIGVWSCSANALLAINKVNMDSRISFQIVYYGLTATFDSKYRTEVAEFTSKYGIANNIKAPYTSKASTLIVKAGKDTWGIITKTTNEFAFELSRLNLPFELINYPEGVHSFDILDGRPESINVIKATLDFVRRVVH